MKEFLCPKKLYIYFFCNLQDLDVSDCFFFFLGGGGVEHERQPGSQLINQLVGRRSVHHSVCHIKLNPKSYLCDGSLSGDIFMTATTFPRSSYSTSLMPGGRPYWACL